QAWISVPSTVKCSSLNKSCWRASTSTASSSRWLTAPAINRSRFLVNTVTSHTSSSISKPTNQRYSRLYSSCSINCRSERIEYSTISSSARSSRSGATDRGLGLSIAKWIVEAHQGKISAASKVGEGSVFRVQIPLSEDGL